MSITSWALKLLGLAGQAAAKEGAVVTAPVGTAVTLATTGNVKILGRKGDLSIVYTPRQ